jgi:putative ABC transport system substrate-binding protein
MDPIFMKENKRIAALAASERLPTIFGFREYVEAGGTMSYGVNLSGNWRRAAFYVDRILKGTKPGDLPIELPTTFELVVNLKTAKAIGSRNRSCCAPTRLSSERACLLCEQTNRPHHCGVCFSAMSRLQRVAR